LANVLDMRVELPALAWLADSAAAPYVTTEQVAVTAQKLTYQPGVDDVWNLPAAEPAIIGALEWEDGAALMRCALPLPPSGEAALYRVTVLKTGATLDAEGKTRADQLLPTEEELLFFLVSAAEGGEIPLAVSQRLVPGVQCVIVPTPKA